MLVSRIYSHRKVGSAFERMIAQGFQIGRDVNPCQMVVVDRICELCHPIREREGSRGKTLGVEKEFGTALVVEDIVHGFEIAVILVNSDRSQILRRECVVAYGRQLLPYCQRDIRCVCEGMFANRQEAVRKVECGVFAISKSVVPDEPQALGEHERGHITRIEGITPDGVDGGRDRQLGDII